VEVASSRRTGVEEGFCFNVNDIDRVAVIDPIHDASEWTTIITPDRRRFGAGMVAYHNRLGGRTVTVASGAPGRLYASYHRQILVQAAIRYISGGRFESAIVTGGPYLLPMHFESTDSHFVVVFNGSPDPAKPVVSLGASCGALESSTLLVPLEEPRSADVSGVRGPATQVASKTAIPYLGFLVLQWGKCRLKANPRVREKASIHGASSKSP
jgi:hypothetical protein